jgi:two-component system OmpR family sensor kinase
MLRLRLRARFAAFTLVVTLVALLVFASAAFVAIVMDERDAPNAPLDDEKEAARQVLVAMAIALPLGLGAAGAFAYWFGGRIAKPIVRIADGARTITAEDLGTRLEVPEADDELRALVVAENALLARLEAGFEAMKSFSADASHELRTPLAVLRAELEVALRRPRSVDEWERTARRSLEEIHRLNAIVEALLVLARAGADAAPGSTHFGVLCGVVRRRFAGEAAGAGVDLSLDEGRESAEVPMPEGSATIAISNLVSNAIRHGKKNGRVRMGFEIAAEETLVHVDDDGPGVKDEEVPLIVLPFRRGAGPSDRSFGGDAEGRPAAGVGLGLHIAKRLVEQHGGALRVERSPLGGARFTLAWPSVRA